MSKTEPTAATSHFQNYIKQFDQLSKKVQEAFNAYVGSNKDQKAEEKWVNASNELDQFIMTQISLPLEAETQVSTDDP